MNTQRNYKNGNVISLSLKNFQTFKSSIISFSPSLNFIIGPNGSGKSTISNALSLIFSGTPKTIGKTKNIKEYIRFGEHDCKIEAEIFYNNEIIKLGRGITVANNLWYINGEIVKKGVYDNFISKLNIDINNLCQYLPQEKVSEFCRMSSEELLSSTLLSLNREDLLENIKCINNIEGKLKEASSEEEAIVKQKEELEKVVEIIKNDVEKMKERDEKIIKIDKLESKIIYLEYDSMIKDYKRLDNSIKILQKNYDDYIKEIESIDLQIENIKNNPKNVLLNTKLENLDEFDDKIKVELTEIKKIRGGISLLEIDLEHLEKKREERQHNLKKIQQTIESNKEELEKIKQTILEKREYFVNEEEEYHYKKSKVENNEEDLFFIFKTTNLDSLFVKFNKNKINELEDKKYNLNAKKSEIEQKCFDIKREVDALEDRKKKFLEAEERRLEQLKKYSFDTYKGVVWLRENKNIFDEEVIEPPFLNIQISDERFLEEIEIFLSFHALTSFICKNQRDFEKLSRICKEEMKLGLNIVEKIKNIPKIQYTNEQVKKLGFDGLVIDFIDTREEIKNFLMVSCHLHNIPITKRSINDNYIFEKTSFKRIAADGKYLEIRRSKYDSKDSVVICQTIRSKNLFSTKIDTSEIEKRLLECNELRRSYNEELRGVLNKSDKIDYELKKEYESSKEHNNQIMKIKTLINCYKTIIEQLKTLNLELKQSEDVQDLIKTEQEINKKKKIFSNQISKINDKIIEILKDPKYLLLLQDSISVYKEIKLETSKLQALLNSKNNIDRQNNIIKSNITDQERVKDKLKPELELRKAKLREKQYRQEEMSQLPDNIEELTNLIHTEKTQLKFLNVNEINKTDYETTKKRLEDLVMTIEKIKNDKLNYNENIQIKKRDTKKDIKELVSKINNEFKVLFNKLNCKGEIKFENEDDLCQKWNLSIYVKFREAEKLEKLSSFRQSGGEKSVSTILFLLALQKIVSSPFRLVDEINQGMDTENEKNVLEMLFDICENDKNTQFFIISPKLVEGLTYNKSMRVIILFSDQNDKIKEIFNNF